MFIVIFSAYCLISSSSLRVGLESYACQSELQEMHFESCPYSPLYRSGRSMCVHFWTASSFKPYSEPKRTQRFWSLFGRFLYTLNRKMQILCIGGSMAPRLTLPRLRLQLFGGGDRGGANTMQCWTMTNK